MPVELTKEQKAAVFAGGGPILVSAAAGSGKTRVLVERALRRVCGDEGVNIDDLLIITFTNAAAAEMRFKLTDALFERLAMSPDELSLRRQTGRVHGAWIMTVHAFCQRILRERAVELSISPDFRLSDEHESQTLMERALENVLEAAYGGITPGFELLVETLGAGRDDKGLKRAVTDTYAAITSLPFPHEWMDEKLTLFAPGADGSVWLGRILESVSADAESALGALRRAHELCTKDAALSPYAETLDGDITLFRGLAASAAKGWDEAEAFLSGAAFQTLRRAKKGADESAREHVKSVREHCKSVLKGAKEQIFCRAEAALLDMDSAHAVVSELFTLVRSFEEEYSRLKDGRGVLDFSDLEHHTLRLLCRREGGRVVPTEAARELSERFREVMVDEYQDTNAVQDLIMELVSGGGRNLFMVGDVKQSIYRFRLADPTIFLRKYSLYPDEESVRDEPDGARRVVLTRNFRSLPGVTNAVNLVFSRIMSRDFGGIDYGDDERLYPGRAAIPGTDDACEADIIELSPSENDEELPRDIEVEAMFAARRVRELIDQSFPIQDGEATRPVRPGDFAILLRSVKNKAMFYERALRDEGIPCRFEGGEAFLLSPEISCVFSLIEAVCNPRQDIALISVLRSPLFGFEADDLAMIRAAGRESDFFGALSASAESGDKKSKDALMALSELREAALDMSSDRFLRHVYNRFSVLGIFESFENGQTRRQNLLQFFEYARKFEASGFRGVHRFAAYIRSLIDAGRDLDPAPADAAEGGAVSLMSVHKSKGLEFPVVILADLAKGFNLDDLRKQLLIHPDTGPGIELLDLDRRLRYKTPSKAAAELSVRDETFFEEARVLYVAMTRAREKLILLIRTKGLSKKILLLSAASGGMPDAQALGRFPRFSDWLLLCLRDAGALLPSDGGSTTAAVGLPGWNVNIIHAEEFFSGKKRDISEKFSRQGVLQPEFSPQWGEYPHRQLVDMPSKLTATQLKGRFSDTEAGEGAPREKTREIMPRPRFVSESGGLSPSEKGEATHLFLQLCDFSCVGSPGWSQAELGRMRERRLLSDAQAAAVESGAVEAFLASPLGTRLHGSDKVLREFKFSLLDDASKYSDSETGGGMVMLQGVVDAAFEQDGALTVIDFKTDFVPRGGETERAEVYRTQIRTYVRALKRITGKPVAEAHVFFLRTGADVSLSFPEELI